LNSYWEEKMNDFMQRGYAAVKARDPAVAAQWFEKALEENPEDGQAMAWLGQCLCSTGRRHEGCIRLREAGLLLLKQSRASRDIAPVLEIIAQLQHWSDLHAALELGAEAVAINGAEFRGWQQLAATYAQLNKKTEAIGAGRKALEIAPENTMMAVFLGSIEADAGQNEVAKARLEKVLRATLNPRDAYRAHKELARVLDKLGQYDQIFAHLRTAAKLAALVPEYSRQDFALLPRMLKANTAGFDGELLGRWAETAFPEDPAPPTFVIGFFRSGTTLTQEVLDAHPDVFVADEQGFVTAMQRELHQMDRSEASTADKLRKLDISGIAHLRDFYWSQVRGRFGDTVGQRHFVDKFTLNTVDLGLINCVFPDAKVVFVLRDPRDICLSCVMQLMVPTPATVHLQSLEETARFYAQVMNWWMHIKPLLALRFIEFRYEDAVEHFEQTFQQVFAFLGVSWDPAVGNFHEHAARKAISTPSRGQVVQPLYSSSVARWRHFESEFMTAAAILEPFVTAFGYEAF
jgi:tetratricopeptide (TPR) repeat protein